MTIARIQMRRDSTADWASDNPTLTSGEIGVDQDTGRFKIGNNSTAWSSLNFVYGKINVVVYGGLNAAITAIGSTPTVLEISNTQTLTGDCTVPSTAILSFLPGGSVALAGHTLSVENIDAGYYQIISGTGTVSGLLYAKPEWFGAVGDGTTDDRAAIQKTVDAMSAGIVYFRAKTYRLGTVLVGSYHRCISIKSNIAFWGAGMMLTTLKVIDDADNYYSMFCHATPGTTVNDVEFRDMTINQNSSGNPMVTFPPVQDSAHLIISVGGASSGMLINRVRFDEVSGVGTIVVADNTIIKYCEFLQVGNDTTIHDHSTIYTNGDNNVIAYNLFQGYAVNAKGAYTAIETHGKKTKVCYNTVDSYYGGMNITGVSTSDDYEVDVSHNTMKNVKCGIKIWSQTYLTSHTSGYGINGLTIAYNQIYIDQHEWGTGDGWDEEASGIRFYGSSANLPCRAVDISHNTISYEVDTDTAREHSTTNGGICWVSPATAAWLTATDYAVGTIVSNSGSNYVCHTAHTSGTFADDLAAGLWHVWNPGLEKSRIDYNTIINCPISAIQLMTKLTSVSVKGNKIWNAGSTVYSGSVANAYKSAILLYLLDVNYSITDVNISQNTICDNLSAAKMYAGVYIARGSGAAGVSVSNLNCKNNEISYTGTVGAYSRPYYVGNTEFLPVVHHTLPQTEAYVAPGSYMGIGSTFYEPASLRLRTFLNSTATTSSSITRGTAAPTSGAWLLGDTVINTSYGPYGWRCVKAGSPGTWVQLGGETLLSVTTVSFAANADTNLFTVPTGYRCVLTKAVAVAAGNAGATTQISIGANGSETDFLGAYTLSNLDAEFDSVILMPVPNSTPVKCKSYAATTVIQAKVENQSGAAGNTVYLYGTLYAA